MTAPSTPAVLFLDDAPERRSRFISLVPHGECVETAKQCVTRLAAQAWDVVFLDHDLGSETYAPTTRGNSGSGVVRWVVANKPSVRWFAVHSLNTVAAQQMVADLRDADYLADYVPWGWMRADELLRVFARTVEAHHAD